MSPTKTPQERDDRQASQMGEITAKLEHAARDRQETREVMRAIQETLTDLQIAMGRMTEAQQETARRLAALDHTIGDSSTGISAKVELIKSIQMLDQSSIADLEKRVIALETKADGLNKWALSSMAAAVISLLLVIGRILKLVP